MNNPVLLYFAVGFSWAAAPLMLRASTLSPTMMGILVTVGGFIVALPFVFSQNYTHVGFSPLALGLAGGIVNGIGVFAFYRLVSGAQEGLWSMSTVLPASIILMLIGIALGARIFFNETISTEKMIGLALACGAVWFLSK